MMNLGTDHHIIVYHSRVGAGIYQINSLAEPDKLSVYTAPTYSFVYCIAFFLLFFYYIAISKCKCFTDKSWN